jgi:hypothetical protein
MKNLIAMIAMSLCLASFAGIASANRLTDPNYNRCSDDSQIPPEQCASYQDLAWNGGNGCITLEEYQYAEANFIAPLCSPFNPQQYLGYCRCGCLARQTEVFVEQAGAAQWVPIERLPGHEAETSMFSLSANATMQAWDFGTPKLMAMTIGPEKKPLVWVTTSTGHSIGLTETHGVLLATGFMARAVELKVGDALVDVDGVPQEITAIDRRPADGDVYNVLTNAGLNNKPGHIIFANQLAVGDLYWQNVLESEFQQLIIRE